MYWFRAGNPLVFVPWLAVMVMWWLGGWLLARHAFRLEKSERLLAGFGLGLVSYLWFANLLGRWLSTTLAFPLAGILVLGAGLAFAWKSERPWLDWTDLHIWPVLVAGIVPLGGFLMVSKGLAIFDEPKNLTIISLMATGDIPPHYYMNADFFFRYHYGFQLMGATLMRLGGMFPWSAFDLAKAIVFAYALLLAILVGKRTIRHPLGGIFTAGVLAFASGTRYMLMLLPASFLQHLDPVVNLMGTSTNMNVPFSQALFRGWTQDGGPPIPFQFGFLNGIFPPLVMAHAGSYMLSVIILGLLLLLVPRIRHPWAFLILAVMLSFWALAWESSYGLFIGGGMLASFYLLWKKKTTGIKAWISGGDFWKELFRQETLAMMLSVPIVLLQGGTITEMARKMIFGSAQAGIGVEGAVSSTGFTFRWPPAIFSSHLGALSLSSPRQLMIALFELGPVILLTPWITIWAWKRLRAKEWIFGALILSAWIGFLGPLVLSYQAERDISRFTGHALLVWMLLLCLMVWDRARGWGKILQYIGVVSLILMVVGGLVTTGAELSAITQPVLGYELTGMDARIARDTWDRLPAGSQVFDSGWWRASALIGRQTRVAVGNTPTPEWLALANSPVPQRLLDSGYRYVYVDEIWWESLPGEYRTALSSDCVKIVKEYWNKEKTQFRRLLDLSECSP